MSILDDLPDLLNDVMGDLLFYDAVLRRDGASTGPDYDPTPGSPQFWNCKALETEWSANVRSGGLVAANDRQLIVLASSLRGAVPQEGDLLQIKGKTFLISGEGGAQPAVGSDPANATYTCRGKA